MSTSTNPDMAHVEALEAENRRLREALVKIERRVNGNEGIPDAATDKLFKRLSGIEVLRNSVQQKEPQS